MKRLFRGLQSQAERMWTVHFPSCPPGGDVCRTRVAAPDRPFGGGTASSSGAVSRQFRGHVASRRRVGTRRASWRPEAGAPSCAAPSLPTDTLPPPTGGGTRPSSEAWRVSRSFIYLIFQYLPELKFGGFFCSFCSESSNLPSTLYLRLFRLRAAIDNVCIISWHIFCF